MIEQRRHIHVRWHVSAAGQYKPQTPFSGCLNDCNTVVLDILYVSGESVHDPVCVRWVECVTQLTLVCQEDLCSGLNASKID